MGSGKKIWEDLGASDPYYAVYSIEKFLTANLDEAAVDEFFASGRKHCEQLWADFKDICGFEPRPKRALDFGCGVGRILFALAERSQLAVGVDISEAMLTEAKRKIGERGIANVEVIETEEFLAKPQKFDLIHSFIVLQHIEPRDGLELIKHLIDLLEDDGVGMLHVTYRDPSTPAQKIKRKVYGGLGPFRAVVNKIRGRQYPPWAPVHEYEMNAVLNLLQGNGCHKVGVRFTDHGMFGAMIFFQKGGSMDY